MNEIQGSLIDYNFTAERFDRWTVMGIAKRRHGQRMWGCRCDCGVRRFVSQNDLRNGKSRSCGCLKRELTIQRLTTHGKSRRDNRSDEYKIWCGIKARCFITSATGFQNYGGRGITVCERWKDSFQNFIQDMGLRPSEKHSIDRIENAGNYTPENCRWTLRKEQNWNKRSTRFLTINGVTKRVADWASGSGLRKDTLFARIKSGIPEHLLLIPAIQRGGVSWNKIICSINKVSVAG